MITVPPGLVTLSDRRTQRRWSVELASYELAAFPVIQARYAQVIGQRPSTSQGDQLPVEGVRGGTRSGSAMPCLVMQVQLCVSGFDRLLTYPVEV